MVFTCRGTIPHYAYASCVAELCHKASSQWHYGHYKTGGQIQRQQAEQRQGQRQAERKDQRARELRDQIWRAPASNLYEIQHRDLQRQCQAGKEVPIQLPCVFEKAVPQTALRSGVYHPLKSGTWRSSFTVQS